MGTQYIPRPGRFPFHGETLTVTLPTVAEGVGYVAGTIADPAVANALGQSSGRWLQQIDLAKLEIDDIVSVSTPVLVRGRSLEYPTGVGLANLTPDQTPVVISGGGRIDFDETVLSIGGANPITFPANMRTWIYGRAPNVGEYPAIRVESVALATPSAPQSGEVVLGGVDTNGSDVTANLASDLGETWHFDVPLALESLLSLRGPAARHTHAATGGWQDKFRPSLRTFTASGKVGLGAPPVNLPNFTSNNPSDDFVLFSASLPNSGVITFEITVTTVTGIPPDDDPQAQNISQYQSARWHAVALRDDGDFVDVKNSVIDYVTGNAIYPSPAYKVDKNGSQLRIVASFDAAYDDHPYRIGYSIRASAVEILDP